jgi:hypothetical protein
MWVSQRSALRPPPFSAPNSRSTPIFYRSLHSASAAFIFMLEFRMLSRNFARTWATRMQPSNLASEFLDGPLPRSIRRNSLSPVFTNVSALFLAPSAICQEPTFVFSQLRTLCNQNFTSNPAGSVGSALFSRNRGVRTLQARSPFRNAWLRGKQARPALSSKLTAHAYF